MFIVRNTVSQHFPADTINGPIENRLRRISICSSRRWINKSARTVAPGSFLAFWCAVARRPAHRILVWVLWLVGISGRAGPVVCLPDEDSLDFALPALPKPDAHFGRWVVDEQCTIGRLRACADVPPEFISVLSSLFGCFVFVVRAYRTPDVRAA